jgi:hypothetical protein
MAELSKILQEITVSNQVGANYSNLNIAIASIGTIKTFKIESAISLTANIVFPAGCILILGSQGSLSGAFTLTGNKTVLKLEGNNTCFGTNVIYAGTWISDNVKPEWWGAVGDGITDDYAAILSSIAFCKLTDSKRLCFNKTTYRNNTGVNISGLTIIGNGANIVMASGTCFAASGAIGAFYNLSGNAYKGDSWIKCSDATLLASLAFGDLIKIVSNEVIQPDSLENVRAGEMHEVTIIDAINGYIYFDDYLFHSYSTTDIARLAKVNYIELIINNLSIDVEAETELNHQGLELTGIKNLVLDNVFVKAHGIAISIEDCYAPLLRVKTFNTNMEGNGYGVFLGAATMYANVEGLFIGARHSITTGGGGLGTTANLGGITWAAKVHDSVGTSGLSDVTIFDTHASSGSIYYDNVIAIGGVFNSYISDIVDWDNSTTFTVTSLVRSVLKVLYSASIENSNVNPDTDINGNWAQSWPGEGQSGFKAEGLNEYYNNCCVYGCFYGVRGTGTGMSTLSVKNFENKDVANPVFIYTTCVLNQLIVDGVHAACQGSGNYVIRLAGTITYWSFNNIHAKNLAVATFLSLASIFPDRFVLNNFSSCYDLNIADRYAISVTIAIVKQIHLRNGELERTNLISTYDQPTETAIEMISVDNVYVNIPNGDVVSMQHAINYVMINGLQVRNPSAADYFIYFKKATLAISINNTSYIGTNATKLIFTLAAVALGKILHNNNLFPNLTDFATGTGALAAIECVGGSLGVDRVIRGVGSPLNVVSAPIGTLYLRSDGGANTSIYIKESATDSTGWVAK